jgi:hypothetical protein
MKQPPYGRLSYKPEPVSFDTHAQTYVESYVALSTRNSQNKT